MNWEQLYTAATPAEREEILITMFQALEARQQKVVLSRGRLLRERRRTARLHFIRDRRVPINKRIARALVRSSFIFILVTLSIAAWLITANIHPMYGAPLLLGYNLILLAILLAKPYQRVSLSLAKNAK